VKSRAVAAADTVLVVEDDAETRRVVEEALAADGHRVTAVGQGEAGGKILRAGGIAAVVLDVGLPDGSGIDLCREWRRAGIRVPILILTARTDVSSRVKGLDAGADDYIGKPFALSELRARLRALLRRGTRPVAEQVLERGPLRVDFGRRQAWVGSAEVPLTRRELEVLERLFWAKGHAVSRDDLLEEVWGKATPETAASLEVIIARLRRKLEGGAGTVLIRTLRGYGYALARLTGSDKT
jgi:two-component system, OmpR family, response regulator